MQPVRLGCYAVSMRSLTLGSDPRLGVRPRKWGLTPTYGHDPSMA